jgi:CPA2 family monovalent cation:H+ antiporter-2
MPHDTPLITTIVAGLVLAFVFGALANRLRMPPLVGYLIAGLVVGPYTPGFVADTELATELSELGVILLMFGIGLNFSLKDMVSVQAVAVPGALIRILVATAMGTGLGLLMGWPLAAGLIFGLALSVASTVVVLKALHDRHLVDSDKGRIIVGWVIVEDIAMVLALVLIPALASVMGFGSELPRDPFVNLIERYADVQLDTWGIVGVTVFKLAAFVGLMLVVGRRLIPMVLHFTAHTGSRELFRLAVLAIALGVAAGAAYLFGISLALGAFFAGMILSESELSQRAAQETLPLRDAFAVLFFVSVGMLFNPTILLTDPLPLIGTLAIILLGKSAVAYLTLIAFRRPVSTALVVTAGLSQIGEFSFILTTIGLGLGILSPQAGDLIVAGAIISIILNPVLFWIAERLRPLPETASARAPVEPMPAAGEPVPAAPPREESIPEPTALRDHVVLVGYGRVGTVVAQGLVAAGRPFVVIEDSDDRVAAAHAAGLEVIVGNAANPRVLGLANLEGARTAVVAIPNSFEAGQAVQQCRSHNSGLFIIARAHSDEEERYLLDLGANQVIMGEREIALGMVETITRDTRAVAEIVAADAVEAALAPVAAAAAATRTGPDIFAPAVEPPPAVAVVPADVVPAEPAPPVTPEPVAPPVRTAELFTLDFGARRPPPPEPILAPAPVAEEVPAAAEEAAPEEAVAADDEESAKATASDLEEPLAMTPAEFGAPIAPPTVEEPEVQQPEMASPLDDESADDQPVAPVERSDEPGDEEPAAASGLPDAEPEPEPGLPDWVTEPAIEPEGPEPAEDAPAAVWSAPTEEPVVAPEPQPEPERAVEPAPAVQPEQRMVAWPSNLGDDPWAVGAEPDNDTASDAAAEPAYGLGRPAAPPPDEGPASPTDVMPPPDDPATAAISAEVKPPLAAPEAPVDTSRTGDTATWPADAAAPAEDAAAPAEAKEERPVPSPAIEDDADAAQAIVEGTEGNRRPRPFGPATTAGNPFATPAAGGRND